MPGGLPTRQSDQRLVLKNLPHGDKSPAPSQDKASGRFGKTLNNRNDLWLSCWFLRDRMYSNSNLWESLFTQVCKLADRHRFLPGYFVCPPALCKNTARTLYPHWTPQLLPPTPRSCDKKNWANSYILLRTYSFQIPCYCWPALMFIAPHLSIPVTPVLQMRTLRFLKPLAQVTEPAFETWDVQPYTLRTFCSRGPLVNAQALFSSQNCTVLRYSPPPWPCFLEILL